MTDKIEREHRENVASQGVARAERLCTSWSVSARLAGDAARLLSTGGFALPEFAKKEKRAREAGPSCPGLL